MRERREDIPLLVHYFVGRYATRIGRKISDVPDETMERLTSYAWPGNVRELENVIERAVILSPGPDLEVAGEALAVAPKTVNKSANDRRDAHQSDREHDAAPDAASPSIGGGPLTLEEMERRHIAEILKRTEWKIDGPKGAARLLELNPSTLRSRIKKLGIRRGEQDVP